MIHDKIRTLTKFNSPHLGSRAKTHHCHDGGYWQKLDIESTERAVMTLECVPGDKNCTHWIFVVRASFGEYMYLFIYHSSFVCSIPENKQSSETREFLYVPIFQNRLLESKLEILPLLKKYWHFIEKYFSLICEEYPFFFSVF